MNPILKNLYTKEELQEKVERHIAEYEKFQIENNYRKMAFRCYDIARIFILLEEKEKSDYYYQKIVDDWNAHPDEVPDWICVNALEAMGRPEEALQVVLMDPAHWMLIKLAILYEKLGKQSEARLLYAAQAVHSRGLSEVYCSFWRPHYLQKTADYWERAGYPERDNEYNRRADEAWEEVKDNIGRNLHPIEEAWLYEEIGYIYEKVRNLETAMEYYQKAKSKYELAYTEEHLDFTEASQVDGDLERYWDFFALQIPGFRLIDFYADDPEENDYRRIKYRILNLEEQMKTKK